ncbi:DUF2381 family protein [Pyxidicoccus xibeiensis]|uniref:DUF2381 family protein n=1 Tax=Pyxidicoccus xibeiensis TaxID=2906759 RepID=UPI0020A7C161|nr:DUF2381 family protein [Pyxidicoccus xibeiensis]MCP3139904.1 DUF2381 family protein [Pyxidicoccus xibeiensis]
MGALVVSTLGGRTALSLLHGLALVLLPFLAGVAAAQPLAARTPRVREALLTDTPVTVHMAPGVATLLLFDADLDTGRTVLEPRERFTLHTWSARVITLEPLEELKAPAALTVRFQGAAVTEQSSLSLVAAPAEVDAQVRLVRSTGGATQALRSRVAELEGRVAACEARLEGARESAGALSPTAFVLAGRIGSKGVDVVSALAPAAPPAPGRSEPSPVSFVANDWLVVTVKVDAAVARSGWKPERAWLVGEATGARFAAHTVQLEPGSPRTDGTALLVVEAARPPVSEGLLFRLEVHVAGGQSPLSIPGVLMKKTEKFGP